jgi:hypothetical protein
MVRITWPAYDTPCQIHLGTTVENSHDTATPICQKVVTTILVEIELGTVLEWGRFTAPVSEISKQNVHYTRSNSHFCKGRNHTAFQPKGRKHPRFQPEGRNHKCEWS